MGLSIGDFAAFLHLDKSAFVKGLQEAEGTAKTAGANIGASITSAVTKGMATLGVAASAVFTTSIASTVQWGSEIAKLSRELGISAEQASGLADVSDDLGVGVDTLSASFGIFSKHLMGIEDLETAAVAGGKGFADTLKDLGVSMTDASGNTRDFNDILPEIADRFKAMPDGMEKSALAMQLFGRGGKELIPVLNQGGDALRNAAAEAERVGLSMSGENLANVKAFKLAGAALGDSLKGVAVTIGNELLPKLTPFILAISEGIIKVKDFVKSHGDLISKLVIIGTVLGGPLAAITALGSMFGVVGFSIAPILSLLGTLAGLVPVVAGALAAAFAPVIVPIAAVVAGILLLVATWNNLVKAFGRNDLILTFDAVKQAVGGLIDRLLAFIGVWDEAKRKEESAKDALVAWNGQVAAVAAKLPEHADAIRKLGDEIAKYQDLVNRGTPEVMTNSTTSAAEAAAFAQKMFEGYKLTLAGLQGQFGQYKSEAQSATTATQNAGAATGTAAKQAISLTGAIKGIVSAGVGLLSSALNAEKLKLQIAAAQAAASVFISGLGGLRSALDNLGKPSGPQPFGGLDFEAEEQRIAGLKAKLPGLEENLRRVQGISTAKEFNWKFPDPNIIAQLEAEIASTKNEIAQTETKMGDMTAANNEWGNQGKVAVDKVKEAFKELVGQQILSWQMSGQISDETADDWRKAAGIVQTDTEKSMLNMTRIMDSVKDESPAVQQAVTTALSGIMNTFDGNTKTMSTALQQYWDDLTSKAKLYGITVAALPAGPGGGGGGGGSGDTDFNKHKNGDPAGAGMVYWWDPTLGRWSFIPDPNGGNQGEAVGAVRPQGGIVSGALSAARSAASSAAATAAQVVASIQQMLDQFKSLSIDPRVQEMANIANTVLGAFNSGMTALTSLDKFIAPARSVVDAAFADILYLTQRLLDAGNRFDTALQWPTIKSFGETGNTLLGMFATGVGALKSLDKYTSPSVDAINAVLSDIVYITNRLIEAGATFDAQALTAATALAVTASAIGSAIGAMVGPLKEAATFPDLVLGAFAPFATALERIVTWFVFAATKFSTDGLAAANKLAETAGLIGDALGRSAQSMQDAAKFPVLMVGAFAPIATAIERLVIWFVFEAAKYTPEVLTAASGLADTVSSIGASLRDLIDVIAAVVAYQPAGGLSAGLILLLADLDIMLTEMMAWFGRMAPATKTALVDAGKAAADAANLVSPVTSFVSSIVAMADYQPAVGLRANVERMLVDLGMVLALMAAHFGAMVPATVTLYTDAAKAAAVAASLISPVSTIVDAIKAASGYVAATGLLESVQALIADMGVVVWQLATEFSSWMKPYKDTVAAAGANAVLAAALLAPVTAMVDGVKAVTGYVATTGLSASVGAFLADMGVVLWQLAVEFESWLKPYKDAVAAAGANAAAAAALLAPVSGMVDAIKAVTGYTAANRLSASVQAMMEDANAVIGGLLYYFSSWDKSAIDMHTLAGQAAAAFASVLAPVSTIVDAIKAVTGYVAASRISAAVSAMMEDANAVIGGLLYYFLAWDEGAITLHETMGRAAAAFASVLAPVTTMVDAIKAIVSLPALNAATMATNMAALLLYAEQFIAGVIAMAGRLEADGVTAAGKLAESGQKIFDMGSAGLGFLEALANLGTGYITPLKMQVVGEMMAYVLNVMIWLAYQIAPSMMVAAATFAAYAQPVFDLFKTGVDFLNDLATAAMPDKAKIQAFADALKEVLGTLTTALGVSAAINGTVNAIGVNLGAGYTLPDFVTNPISIPMPSMPAISWPSLPGRPATGGGGGGGGGGAGGEVIVKDFGTAARQVLATLAGAPGATADELLRQMKWRTDTGA
jgi:hypothetical protein